MDSEELSFGQWVRQRRQALHLTQQQLGALSGCAAETIRKIESDLRSPSPKVALLIAQALQLRPTVHMAFVRWARGDIVHMPALLSDNAPRVALSYGDSLVESVADNLPIATSSLVGRDGELSTLQRVLAQARVRLVTLTGPGGVGKTRLAIAAAQSQRTSFPDGCFFVSLANITDPALVLSTIAQTFDVSEVPSQPLRASLQSFLREKVVLLVLDNFEQVLGAGILVGELLEAAPRLTVLVTSRAPLRLRGEHEYVVRPLAVPAKPAADRTEMLHYAAVRLFLERAQAVKTDFQFDDETAAAVAEITARLDGLPLAIELAAARVKILQPQALLKRLGKSLALLTGGAHDFPSRHQTLRATIDWSYNLLEPEEKLLFARLAVFVGSWSLDAAEAVCNAPGDLAVGLLDGIQSLVNKSMLQQVDGEPGEPRFTMLETIHEYAAERLVDCDDIHDIQLQHALYFLKLAEEAEPQLTGMAQQVQLNRLDAEYENFRAALRWLVDQREAKTALRLCNALGRFWWMRGHLREGLAWLKQVLDSDEAIEAKLRARGLYWMAILANQQGDYRAAERSLGMSLAISQQAQDRYATGLALNALGVVANAQGEHDRARQWYTEGLALYRDLGDQERIATLLNNLGFTKLIQHEYAQARELLEESLQLSNALEDAQGKAFGLNNLGLVALRMNDLERAQSMLRDSLAQFWQLRDQRNCAEALEGLAELAVAQGHALRAAQLLAAASALRMGVGAVRNAYEQHQYLAIQAAISANLEAPDLALATISGQGMSLEQAARYALGEGEWTS